MVKFSSFKYNLCVCGQCDVMIEQYEDVIEDWYKGSQEEDLTTYLCEKHVLKGQDRGNARTHNSDVTSMLLFFVIHDS